MDKRGKYINDGITLNIWVRIGVGQCSSIIGV